MNEVFFKKSFKRLGLLLVVALVLIGGFVSSVPKVYADAGPNTITKTDVTPGLQLGTFTGVPVYRFHVANAGNIDDSILTIYPTPSGSVVDTLVRLHFYKDANNNGVVDGGDTDLLVGGVLIAADNAGQIVDISNVTVPAGGSVNILITADGTDLANGGSFILSIADAANVVMQHVQINNAAPGANLNALTINTAILNLPYISYNGQNLYISPTDSSSAIGWGGSGITTGAISMTDGATNTATIVSALGDGSDFAAGLCSNLTFDGYSDWYLPAYDQLFAMYDASSTVNKGDYSGTWADFAPNIYWSSYDTYPLYAGITRFSDGGRFSDFKSSTNYVRCVRSNANPIYAVTYDDNGSTGGTVPTDPLVYETGSTVTALGNTGSLVRTGDGYTFVGWNTADNGSGTNYAPASTFAMGSVNLTLFAKWGFTTYEVTDGTMTRVSGDTTSTVNIDTTPVADGATVTLTVVPKTGMQLQTSTLTATYDDGSQETLTLSGSGPYTFTMPAYAVTVTATFEAIPVDTTLTPTVSKSSGRNGSSVASRVANLIEMGNTQLAGELKTQYPSLFPSTSAPVTMTSVGIPSSSAASADSNTSTSTSAFVFTRDLKLGSVGEDVKQLQIFLNGQGFFVSKIAEGSKGMEIINFGPATKSALFRFQLVHDIRPASGYFGPKTRAFITKM